MFILHFHNMYSSITKAKQLSEYVFANFSFDLNHNDKHNFCALCPLTRCRYHEWEKSLQNNLPLIKHAPMTAFPQITSSWLDLCNCEQSIKYNQKHQFIWFCGEIRTTNSVLVLRKLHYGTKFLPPKYDS